MKLFKTLVFPVLLLGVVTLFFYPTIIKGLLPIPTDALVGLYYPYRDFLVGQFPNGYPFKNFLITDPVRQIIPWKMLVIDMFQAGNVPLWNPYETTGKPLLANFQASPWYFLNLLLFIQPFYFSWTLFIMLQPLLAGIFFSLYIRNLSLDKKAAMFGATAWIFSGFFVAWLEWGNVLHTALWLPLVLLSIDKIFAIDKRKEKVMWLSLFVISLASSLFAGYLQTFFYIVLLSLGYVLWHFSKTSGYIKNALLISGGFLLTAIITVIQWVPTLQFISLSARSIDQTSTTAEGWFIPLPHLVQFIIPDFFGNPTTLNYWGTWNYAEMVGYVGIIPLFFALLTIFFKRTRKTVFFTVLLILSLIFATDNPIARIPFTLHIPFISSAQPTRLLFISTFALAVLAASGFDYMVKEKALKKKPLLLTFGLLSALFIGVWIVNLYNLPFFLPTENVATAKRNSILPTLIFFACVGIVIFYTLVKHKVVKQVLIGALLVITVFDLLRFAWKFETNTSKDFFFPTTKTIEFLKKDTSIHRIAVADSRILAPNIATFYKIQSIEGYDPLYLLDYAKLIAASERGKPDINPPFGFNRIITPHHIDSSIIDLLNVKYILSLSDLEEKNLKKVFQEGETRIYENRESFDRVFFVEEVVFYEDQQKQIESMFDHDLKQTAIVAGTGKNKKNLGKGNATITQYSENRVVIKTQNVADGFLVFSDAYYPTWKAFIDGKETKIYKTDFALRGIFVPKGEHEIVFRISLF